MLPEPVAKLVEQAEHGDAEERLTAMLTLVSALREVHRSGVPLHHPLLEDPKRVLSLQPYHPPQDHAGGTPKPTTCPKCRHVF